MINETEQNLNKKFPVGCQISNLGSFWVIFQIFREVGNLNIKITLLKSTFQKSCREVTRGHSRSKISMIGQNIYEIRLIIYQNDAIAVSFPK